MERHITSIRIILVSLAFVALTCYGQVSEAILLHRFKSNQMKYGAVSFTVKKTEISINSFDLNSNQDTSYKVEDYICVRNSKGYKLFKRSRFSDGRVMKSLNVCDSITFVYNDTFASKLNSQLSKFSEFEDAFIFLSGYDSAEYAKTDSFVRLSKYVLKQIGKYQDEYGTAEVVTLYHFNRNGILNSKEVFYDHKNTIPKFKTKAIYLNVKYSQAEKLDMRLLFEKECSLSLKAYRQTQLSNGQQINYVKSHIPVDFQALKSIQKGGHFFQMDSIVKSHRITLFYYWFNGCKPCVKIKPFLFEIAHKYDSLGLKVVGLNHVDNAITIDQADSLFLNYKDTFVNMKFFGSAYPLVVVVNQNGQLIGTLKGGMDKDILELQGHLMEIFGF